MNSVVLIGRLTRDPELKFGQSGTAYSRFSIAFDNPMKKGESNFINCVAFGKTAETIGEYMRKGSSVGITGRIQMNKYESNGEKKTTYDIIVDRIEFVGPKNSQNSSSNDYSNNSYQSSAPTSSPTKTADPKPTYQEENFDDDEFPF